jgi:hypothetical protein
MASFYDSASIITIPSGYKVGTLYSAKPTDGTGDMTFTRTGDTATRVNSAGIIERCITNLALQSNNFSSASWSNSNVTIVGSIADPNGGTTAFSMAGSSATSNVKNLGQASFSSSSDVKTISIYAKANTHSFLQVRFSASNFHVNFDLTNGTFANGSSAFGTMTSIGGGWYRCTVTSNSASTSTIVGIQLVDSLAAVTNEASTTTNSVYIWRAQAQTGDFATNYIPTTTAAVTEGPVTNLPRLDYFGSTCPQLLMEPTRTNLALYSQMLNVSTWGKTGGTAAIVVTANQITSPDGYSNADLVIAENGVATSRIQQNFNAVSGTTYAFSAFVKQGPDNAPVAIRILSAANANLAGINIVFTGGVPAITATGLALNTKAESFGNGWYRISGTYLAPATESNRWSYYADTAGTGKSSYLWGAQLEAGAYATSYIPTTAATVTRNTDQATKTGITSLLGQTEGTLYHDFERIGLNVPVAESPYFGITGGAATRLIIYYNGSQVVINFRVNSVIVYSKAIVTTNTRLKIAIAYKLNDLAVYMNGVLQDTNALSTDFSTYNITRFDFNAGSVGTSNQFQGRTNQALVFKTRLSNAELATLTTL